MMVATAQNVVSAEMALDGRYWLAVPLTAITVVSVLLRGPDLLLSCRVVARVHHVQPAALAHAVPRRRRRCAGAPGGAHPKGLTSNGCRRIQTYDEIGETSAISRLHFWRVALSMSADHPLGIGLWNFQSLY